MFAARTHNCIRPSALYRSIINPVQDQGPSPNNANPNIPLNFAFQGAQIQKNLDEIRKKTQAYAHTAHLVHWYLFGPCPIHARSHPFVKSGPCLWIKTTQKYHFFTISAASNAKKKRMKFEIRRLARILRGSSAKNEQNSKMSSRMHTAHMSGWCPLACVLCTSPKSPRCRARAQPLNNIHPRIPLFVPF